MAMNHSEYQAILDQIKGYRRDLNAAEELLREGKFDKLNELLENDLFHFCKQIREHTEAEQTRTQKARIDALTAQMEAKRKYQEQMIQVHEYEKAHAYKIMKETEKYGKSIK